MADKDDRILSALLAEAFQRLKSQSKGRKSDVAASFADCLQGDFCSSGWEELTEVSLGIAGQSLIHSSRDLAKSWIFKTLAFPQFESYPNV